MIITVSCKTEKKTVNGQVPFLDDVDNDKVNGIKMLKEFYTTFYYSDEIINNDNLKKKIISERILKRIDSLNKDELILGYDPFIKAQDYIGESIANTIKITPLNKVNEFRVSFLLFGKHSKKRTKIDLLLKENIKGGFLIYSVLNDEYLSFKTGVNLHTENVTDEVRLNNKKCSLKIGNNIIEFKKVEKKVEVSIISENKIVQKIDFKPSVIDVSGCKVINYNSSISLHNDFNVVIADYNFDYLLDFAILNDNTINTGTIFSYFFQDKQGEFYQNKNFPLKLIPSKIDYRNKTLTQQNIIGCCKISVNVFKQKGEAWLNILSEEKDINIE